MKTDILNKGYAAVRNLASHLKTSNIILFESINDFDGSSLQIYNYLKENGYDKKYKLVWSVKNPENLGNDKYDSIGYLKKSFRNLCFENKAKYVFFEDLPPVARLKKDQTVVYLTHGCPTIKDTSGKISAGNHCSFSICTNDIITDYMSKQINVEKEKFFICGLPRNDVLFKQGNELEKITKKQFEKVVLWLPTFRKINGRTDSTKEYYLNIPTIENAEQLKALNDFAKKLNVLIIIKFHPRVEYQGDEAFDYSNVIIMSDKEIKKLKVDSYALLTQIDALISDYSSIAFDWLLLGRPIGYVTEDMKDYTAGFALENVLDYMPGEKINSFDELCEFIENISRGVDEFKSERERVCAWANKYRDSNNAKRVVERFIEK